MAALFLAALAVWGCDSTTESAATQALQAAAGAMRAASSYTFVADITGGAQPVHVTGVFSAPDSIHETVTVGTSTLERITIGSHTFSRSAPTAAWTAASPTAASASGDPRSAFNPLANAVASSVQGSTYAFSLTDADAAQLVQGSSSVTGTAVVTGGFITDLGYQSANPQVAVHITYTAINSSPKVTAPPT